MSDPVHQQSSLGTFICCPLSSFSPLASFAMQCVAPSGGSIAFYTASVSHPHEFFVNILGLKSSAAHLFVPQFKTERRLFSRKWNDDTQKDGISSKRKKNCPSFDFKSGFAERPKHGTLKTTQSPCCSFCIPLYLLIYSLSLLKTECKKKTQTQLTSNLTIHI